MKKSQLLFSSLFALGLFTACNNQNNSDNTASVDSNSTSIQANVADSTSQANLGKISFEETAYDFGTVKEGEIVEHVFKFTNTGSAPVILTQVAASCGCTTPDYTKEPILPGKEGEIKVSFDSKGQVGNQQKIVTISSNAENNVTTVQIKGTVK